MADTTKLIKIIFEGVDETTGTIKNIGGGIEDFGKSIGDVAGPVAALGDSILTVDKYLAALAVGGLALASANAITYQDAIADLNKVMGEGETLTDDMKKQQKELASTYGIATAEIIQSQAGLQQSGFDAADSLLVLETSAKLAASSELSAAEATELLKRAMIGYEVGASKAIEIADLWNLTANKSSTDVRKLATGFSIVGRQASNAGFTMEELTAALTPMIGVFQSGSEAGTAMSVALTALNNPSKKATSAIKKLLGISGPINKTFGNTADLFKAVATAISKLPASQRDAVSALITTNEQAKRTTLAFSDFDKELKKVDAASRKIGKSLNDEVKIALELTSIQVDILKVKFTDFFTSVGLQYDKELSGVLSGLSGIFGGFEIAVNNDAFKPLFDLIRTSGVEISTLFEQIAKNLPEALAKVDFKGIADSLDSLKKNIFDIFDDIDLSTTEGLQSAIQLVVDSLDTLIQITDGMLTAWQPLFDAIGEAVDFFNDMDDATKETVGNLIGLAQQLVIFGGVMAATGLVMKAFGAGFATLGAAGKKMVAGKVFSVLASQIDKFRNVMILAASGTAEAVKLLTVGATAGLLAAAAAIGVAIGTLINQIPGVQKAVQGLFAFLENNKDYDFNFISGDTENDIKNKAKALDGYRQNIQKIRDEAKNPIILTTDEAAVAKAFEKMRGDISREKLEARLEINREQIKEQLDESLKQVQKELDGDKFFDGTDFFSVNIELDDKSKESIEQIDEINGKLYDLSQRKTEIELIAEFNTASGKVTPNELALEFREINEQIEKLTGEKKSIQVELDDNDSFQKVTAVQKNLDELTEEKRILELQTDVNNGEGLGEIVSELTKLEDGSYFIELKPELQGKGMDEVKEKIDELSKDKKFLLKIEAEKAKEATKRFAEQSKAQGAIISKAMDIQAKLDIREMELNLEKIGKAFDATKEVLIAVTQASADMFGAFSTDFDQRTLWLYQDNLRQNLDIQREAADQQEKLNAAILRELELKNLIKEKFLAGDKALLTISVDESVEADYAAFVRALIPHLQLWGSENDVSLLIEATT